MFGQNPIRKPVTGDGTSLEVQEIFATLQGEGPLAGAPAVFIRLGGCNLACRFCDTEFETFESQTLEEILATTDHLSQDNTGNRIRKLVVITGGEPFRQPIGPLCDQLLEAGFDVQIETNGTLYRPLDERVMIVCSPKNTGTGYHPVRDDLLQRLQALKFIISTQDPLYQNVGEVGQSVHAIPVYVQPMDEQDNTQNRANTEYAAKLAQEHGYHLSLQQHKILGLP